MSEKILHQSADAPRPVGPYSQAVEAGGFVFLSGQIPIDPAAGRVVEGGIEEQTHRVLRNLRAVLESAGLSLEHVVKTTCLLRDMSDFPAMNSVYAEYFANPLKNPPARTTFAAADLPLGVRIEIDAIAVRP